MKRGAAVILIAVVLPALAWFVTQRGADPEPGSAIPLRDDGHPILLVIDADGIEGSRPRTDADRWFDLEWANILTQAYGGCDIATTTDALARLDGRQLVVLPRRTAAALDAGLLDALDDRVRAGLEVLVEAPDSSSCRRMGLELSAVERRPTLPWPEPVTSGVGPRLALRPRPVPVPWTRLRYAPRPGPPQSRPRVHLSLDGRPMGWALEHGPGAWLVLAVDFAELSARLRQGEDGRPLLAGQDHAWLDAWVEGIFGSAMTRLPLARVAPAPPAHDGWLVVRETTAAGLPQQGWAFGTGVPARSVGRSGRVQPDWRLPAIHAGPDFELDPARLDRWARNNVAEGAGPLVLDLTELAGDALAGQLDDLASRRAHHPARPDDLLAWWQARQELRVAVEETGDTVDYRIESIPAAAAGFGLLVPVRWRDRSLEGWEADWGIAPGRRVQRFDRVYRLIELGPAAAGDRLKLRYR